MLEFIHFDIADKRKLSIYLGILIGVCFGILAQRTKFCFRSAFIVGRPNQNTALWMSALVMALAVTQIMVFFGFVSFNEHRFLQNELPWLSIITGGLLFGAGMVLTRGCVSRLTVLAGTGNLRAAMVLLIFGIVAHSSLKGVLSRPLSLIKEITVNTEKFLNAEGILIIKVAFSVMLFFWFIFIIHQTKPKLIKLLLACMTGLLVPISWVGTGYILLDEFHPIAFESISYTKPYADTLFWIIASSAIPPNFGVGLVCGTVCGSLLASRLAKEFRVLTFETKTQTIRYFVGASMMGTGGVLAGGCSLGAGLAGLPSMGLATILATFSFILGGLLCKSFLESKAFLSVYAGSLDKQTLLKAK